MLETIHDVERLIGTSMRFAVGLIVLTGAYSPAYADASPEVAKKISAVENGLLPAARIKGRSSQSKLADRMAEFHVPGVSIAVINHYQVEWAKAYGMADSGTGATATPDTLFQAASMSKPVMALAALKLVEEKKLDLDRDVNEQLKSWKVPENSFTRDHAVDLRSLLSHTAGTTVHGFPGYKADAPLPTVPQILDGQKPANTQAVRVNKKPGQGFRYSGGGTTIVQQLLTDVTGQPFAELMRESVLAPLGMTASTYEQPLPEKLHQRASSAHDRDGKPIAGRWHVYPEQAAAGLWTTPSEMARYVIEIQLAHEGKSNKLLSRDMIEQMLTHQNGGTVGLGPFLFETGDQRRFEHSGGNEGFACLYVGCLDRGQGAVVMTNANGGFRVTQEVMNAIAAAYEWPGYLRPEREGISLDAATLDRYVGNYDFGLVGSAAIEKRDGKLFTKSEVLPRLEVFFESPTVFFTDDPNIAGQFELDAEGRVTKIVVDASGQKVPGKKVVKPKD